MVSTFINRKPEKFQKYSLFYNNPVYIIGNPRSGTTLLRLMLTNHRSIIIPPECGFLVWWHKKYKNWSNYHAESISSIREFINDLSSSRKIETWQLNYTALTEFILDTKPFSYSELASLVYIFYGINSNRDFSMWGDKNNYYISHLETIYQLFPESVFIYLVRDGRDVACSYRSLSKLNISSEYKPVLPLQLEEIARQWVVNNNGAINFFDKLCWKNVYMIHYEELVRDSETELKKLCSFLSEDFDIEMLNYYQRELISPQEPIEFLQWKKKLLEQPTDSEIGKYKRLLSTYEIGLFNNIAGQLLARFGYIE